MTVDSRTEELEAAVASAIRPQARECLANLLVSGASDVGREAAVAALETDEFTKHILDSGSEMIAESSAPAAVKVMLAAAPVNASRSGEDEPVGWQWNTVGVWRTAEKPSIADPEQYARSMAGEFGRVRPIYTTPRPSELVAALREALEWYGEQVEALQRHGGAQLNTTAIEAVMTALSLDGGKRARAALATPGLAAPRPTVGVKALEWSELSRGEALAAADGLKYYALPSGHWGYQGCYPIDGGSNLDDAKAAAQADYERQRAALTPIEGV